MRKYELFEMGDRETIIDMYTQFTHITNELKSLGKTFTTEELVRKILRFLPRSWEAVVSKLYRKCTVTVVASNGKYGSYPQGTCFRIPELIPDSI